MKILLVDDDLLITESLEIILSNQRYFNVVGMAHNGEEAINKAKKLNPDMVLMDISMPVMNGIQATRILKREFPNLKIVMLTTFLDYKNIHQSLLAGADGYLLKSDNPTKQIETLKMIAQGHAVISKEALQKLTEDAPLEVLTNRENDILELISQGLTNKEIAQTLYMSEGSIRNMISIILEKLDLRDRTQLAIYYWQHKK